MKILLNLLDKQFHEVHQRTGSLLKMIPDEKLFWKPQELKKNYGQFSCGENILRSAGAVEQTFGGITSRLWDDPFEWTLPEELSTVGKISDYLDEVEETRKNGFAFFTSDEDLYRELPAPEKLKTIFRLLIETLDRASHFQGRAFAVFQMFSEEKLTLF